MKYFVYVPGLRGPEPQIWDEKIKQANGKPIKTLFQQELQGNEFALGLNLLRDRYPPPVIEAEK